MQRADYAPLPPVLQVRDVSVRFGGVRALSRLSFDVQPGAVTALIGTNGSGKTTLFNVVAGNIDPFEGSVHFNGEDVTSLPQRERVARGLVRTFQQVRLFMQLTVLDNLLLGTPSVPGEDFVTPITRWRYVNRGEDENVSRVFDFMRSWKLLPLAHRLAGDLSYGEQKLVGIGRAVMARPKLLLVDEPLAGITAKSVNDLLRVLEELTHGGCTVLLVEHNIEAVMQVARHVVVVHLGEKIAEGTPAEVSAHAKVREVYLGG